jgi:hypothetical protein
MIHPDVGRDDVVHRIFAQVVKEISLDAERILLRIGLPARALENTATPGAVSEKPAVLAPPGFVLSVRLFVRFAVFGFVLLTVWAA